jgi:hypothetical protein
MTTVLLKLLQQIEIELRKIGEWKDTRSEDLDWWLPLGEYTQFVTIPEHRAALERNEYPSWQTSAFEAIAVDWIRNPKYEPTFKAMSQYYDQLIEIVSAPEAERPQPIRFFKLITESQADEARSLISKVRAVEKKLRQTPDHREAVDSLDLRLKRHETHLVSREVPPRLDEETLLYFKTVPYDPIIDEMDLALSGYQSWLLENPDNKRIEPDLSDNFVTIEVEVPQELVAKMFDEVFSELGRGMKFPGHKMGMAPLDFLKNEKHVRVRAMEIIARRLMKYEPENTGTAKTSIQFQALGRLEENKPFRFRARYFKTEVS